ncbi:winged helix-turn-helix transcriptional regulator [Roseburia amylophila]
MKNTDSSYPTLLSYALSNLGESMRPILTAMQEWGDNYKATFLS